MKHAAPDPRLTKLKTVARSLKLWVLELVLWVAELTGSREARLWLREEIRHLRADIRLLLVGMVGLELCSGRVSFRRARWTRPMMDTRYAWRRRPMRRVSARGVKLRTLADIKRALRELEVVAAQCVTRYCARKVADACDAPWSVGALAHVRLATPDADEVVRAPDTS